MSAINYICIVFSVFLLVAIIKVIRKKEKKRILRYHGITAKRRRWIFKD